MTERLVDRAAQQTLEQQADVRFPRDLSELAIRDAVADAHGIIIRAKGRISASVIDAGRKLRVIGKHGVGVDNIDVAAAAARGITVVNTPSANARSTAEYCFGLLQAANRQLLAADALVREGGEWGRADALVGRELRGKTLGLVGRGQIAADVARIARFGFEMRIAYWDYRARPWPAADVEATSCSLDELFATCDFVSLHVPGAPSTNGLVSAALIGRMPPHSILINTARGSVVDQDALVQALEERRIRGAALDVMAQEPLPKSRLSALTNVVLTPHTAAYTTEAFAAMARVADDVLGVIAGRAPIHPVLA